MYAYMCYVRIIILLYIYIKEKPVLLLIKYNNNIDILQYYIILISILYINIIIQLLYNNITI